MSTNPRNTISQVKRLMGKKFSDPHVQQDLQYFPFEVVAGPHGECMINVSGRADSWGGRCRRRVCQSGGRQAVGVMPQRQQGVGARRDWRGVSRPASPSPQISVIHRCTST